NRVLSRAETFGRLYACGFSFVDEKVFGNRLYFVFKKVKKPCFDQNPSYGLVFKMKRIGKNGKFVYVYKFRTMYPYSEYLQDFIKKRNGFSKNGKLANDMRVTSWGKFMRKYWIDELPQLINVVRGEMSIVGVRPLSESFMKEFPDDMKLKRQKYKPGCLPPYVALLKQNVKEYIESERIYLAEKEKNPYFTDIKYFTKCIYNITTNKIRSA
ncbi:MAG: sugar transferase, partial [Bacteroidales bacterium]|nr:sugar transferase [Bacteroidales bacterium]